VSKIYVYKLFLITGGNLTSERSDFAKERKSLRDRQLVQQTDKPAPDEPRPYSSNIIQLQTQLWQYLWRWAKRRHPNKNTKWVRKRYFKTIKGYKWTFACTISDRRGKDKLLTLYQIDYTPIERHIKVKGNASPDDPSLKEYWEKRRQKLGKTYFEKGSKLYKVAENQNWKCPKCGEPLFNGEEIETHHIVPVFEGGIDDEQNLQHVHRACHKQIHKTQVKSRLK
jgi:RNA-directed DNA polymerase